METMNSSGKGLSRKNWIAVGLVTVVVLIAAAPMACAQTASSNAAKEARIDFVEHLPPVEGIKVITRGQQSEELVVISTIPDVAKSLLKMDVSLPFMATVIRLGFTKFASSDGKVDLLRADITSRGFENQKEEPERGNARMQPSEAIAAAHAEAAKDGGSPKVIYKLACQVPPDASEYPEAQEIVRKNDVSVRKMGFLNDFLTPLHVECARVAKNLDEPSAIENIQPGHMVKQDIELLNKRASDKGVDVTFYSCGNWDDQVGLCGKFKGQKDAQSQYAKSLFSDKELARQLSLLGYTGVMIANDSSEADKQLVLGMVPTKDGWVGMQTQAQNKNTDPTDSTLKLTKIFSNEKISFPYPEEWEVTGTDEHGAATIAPPNSVNLIKSKDGSDWLSRGILYISPAENIVGALRPFTEKVVEVLLKDDPRVKQGTAVESKVGGRPAIMIDYSTSSAAGDQQEWGFFVGFNSNKGAVVMRLFCPTNEQAHCKERFDPMLQHVTFN